MTDAATHDAQFLGSVFSFKIDGVEGITIFTGVSGLSMDVEVIEHKAIQQGSGKEVLHKIPGRHSYSEVTLKRGLTTNKGLYDWFKKAVDGKVEYKTGEITVMDRAGTVVANFSLEACWPSKMSVSDLNSANDEVVVEELTIQHEFLDWVS